jgi:hypothetical protein
MRFSSAIELTKALLNALFYGNLIWGNLDVLLHEWFVIEQSEGEPVSGPIVIEKAKALFKNMESVVKVVVSNGHM